jgi:hypothetical protein
MNQRSQTLSLLDKFSVIRQWSNNIRMEYYWRHFENVTTKFKGHCGRCRVVKIKKNSIG